MSKEIPVPQHRAAYRFFGAAITEKDFKRIKLYLSFVDAIKYKGVLFKKEMFS